MTDLAPAPVESFTVAVLPDTQEYARSQPQVFYAETQWIADHLQSQRIVFVSHVGDVVHDFYDPAQWAIGVRAMCRLDGRVPYGICPGNNDMDESSGDASMFNALFPVRHFEGHAWYGGHFRENSNSFQFFSAGGLQFVILHLECNAPDDVLAWANGVLEEYSRRRAIVTTHAFLGPIARPSSKEGWFTDAKGVMDWSRCHGRNGNSPLQIWEKCLRRHRNVFLIFCGDQSRTQTMHLAVEGKHGNRVHACLSDYRDALLRLYGLTPRESRIDVFTPSAITGKLCGGTDLAPDEGEHQFSLQYDMKGPLGSA